LEWPAPGVIYGIALASCIAIRTLDKVSDQPRQSETKRVIEICFQRVQRVQSMSGECPANSLGCCRCIVSDRHLRHDVFPRDYLILAYL